MAEEEFDVDAEMAKDGWSRVAANVSKAPRAVYGLRLSPEEFAAFTAAAKAKNMTLSDFLRSSAWGAVEGKVDAEKAAAAAEVRAKARELIEAASRL